MITLSVQAWLERTPGLRVDGFDFWGKFEAGYNDWIAERTAKARVCNFPSAQMNISLLLMSLLGNVITDFSN
jgi:hypothetical protein